MAFGNFKQYLYESILQEAVVRFGKKFIGKDVTQVPKPFWTWLVDAMNQNQAWNPHIEDDNGQKMTRDQVYNLARARSSNKPIVAPPQPPKSVEKPLWVLAKVLDVEGFNKGDFV